MYNNEEFNERILKKDINLNLVSCSKIESEKDLLIKNTLTLLYNFANDTITKNKLLNTTLKNAILIGIYNNKNFLMGNNYMKPNTINNINVLIPCIFLLAKVKDSTSNKLNIYNYYCINFDDVVNTNLADYKLPDNYTSSDNITFEILAIIFNCSYNIKTDKKTIRNFSLRFNYTLDVKKIKNLDVKIHKKINKAENGMLNFITKKINIKDEIAIMNPKVIKSGTNQNKYSELEKVVNNMLTNDKNKNLYVEEKIDGCRCIAVKENDIIKLYKKGGDEIQSLNFIKDELKKFLSFYTSDCIVDGEIFADHNNYIPHELVAGIINSHTSDEKYHLKYYIFDIIDSNYNDKQYCERLATLNNMFINFAQQNDNTMKYIVKNEPEIVKNFNDVLEYINNLYEKHKKRYEVAISKNEYTSYSDSPEGIIIRSSSGIYSNKMSGKYIRKFKFIEDDEFICVGVESDIDGKIIYKFSLSGVSTNDIFSAVIKASHSESKKLLEDFKKGIYNPIAKPFKVRFRVRNNNNIPKEAFVLQEFDERL